MTHTGNKKVVIASIMSILIAILMLCYAGYGWYSMARDVEATGMNVKLTAPNNLEISLQKDTGYSTSVTVSLKEVVANLTKNDAGTFDAENDSFSLLPASSFEGLSMWRTDNALDNGSADCDEGAFLNGHRVMSISGDEPFEGHYLDVEVYLRTASANDVQVGISKSATLITTSNDDKSITGIVRTAFLNEDASDISYTENAAPYNKTLVYADTSKAQTVQVVTANGAISKYIAPSYISFTDDVSDQVISNLKGVTRDNNIFTYHPKKLTLRIWIEGQDSSCIASKLNNKRDFDIQIGFIIKN